MSYRIAPSKNLGEEIRRVAGEQVSKAMAELDNADLDRDKVVHQVRKRCKKLRGLLRLVRPGMEATYANENAAFRDAARLLSSLRDAKTLIGTYDDLMDQFHSQIDRQAFGSIRATLTRRLTGMAIPTPKPFTNCESE